MPDDKSTVIALFPSVHGQGALESKLKRELDVPSSLFSQSFREDIYSVLTLSEWSDEVTLRLIQVPNLLQEIVGALHNDDMLSAFFEQRTRDLILELVEKTEI